MDVESTIGQPNSVPKWYCIVHYGVHYFAWRICGHTACSDVPTLRIGACIALLAVIFGQFIFFSGAISVSIFEISLLSSRPHTLPHTPGYFALRYLGRCTGAPIAPYYPPPPQSPFGELPFFFVLGV